jgi:hypothetical protein
MGKRGSICAGPRNNIGISVLHDKRYSRICRWRRRHETEEAGIMRHIRWSHPIEVGFTQGDAATVSGPSDALHCMADRWPDRRGPLYVAARSVCRAAIDGRRSAEEAREIFISAALEANLTTH